MRRLGTPTVEVVIQVPHEHGNGSWTWVTHPDHSPAGQEPVYDATDLQRVMLGYGAIVAQLLRVRGPNTFRLLACGLLAGRTVGSYQFTWDARFGGFEPNGEPWIVWDELADKLVAELRAGMATTQAIKLPQVT
ncbi:hypothetical protein ACWGJW_02585 [Streptomyces nigrescens]